MTIELDDLESRLREMYAAVAATTVVDDDAGAEGLHRLTAEPHEARGRGPLMAVAAVVLLAVVVALVAILAGRRGNSEPAGPMDGRPFAIPMYMPEDMGLDGTALIDSSGPLGGMEQTQPVLTARLKYDGGNDRTVFIGSADADDLSVAPTGSTVELADGTVAQWDDGLLPRLAWTLPTGQAVIVQSAGPEVSKQELIDIASSLWYVDRATWDAVTAKVGYVSGRFDTWRIPGDGTKVDLVVDGTLRGSDLFRRLSLRTGSSGIGYRAPVRDCSAWSPFDGPSTDDQLVLAVPAGATSVRLIGPNGETIETPVVMAPGLPLLRWATVAFPDAPAQWVTGIDHSEACSAVYP